MYSGVYVTINCEDVRIQAMYLVILCHVQGVGVELEFSNVRFFHRWRMRTAVEFNMSVWTPDLQIRHIFLKCQNSFYSIHHDNQSS